MHGVLAKKAPLAGGQRKQTLPTNRCSTPSHNYVLTHPELAEFDQPPLGGCPSVLKCLGRQHCHPPGGGGIDACLAVGQDMPKKQGFLEIPEIPQALLARPRPGGGGGRGQHRLEVQPGSEGQRTFKLKKSHLSLSKPVSKFQAHALRKVCCFQSANFVAFQTCGSWPSPLIRITKIVFLSIREDSLSRHLAVKMTVSTSSSCNFCTTGLVKVE